MKIIWSAYHDGNTISKMEQLQKDRDRNRSRVLLNFSFGFQFSDTACMGSSLHFLQTEDKRGRDGNLDSLTIGQLCL